MPEQLVENRRSDGTFAPGVSGNPGGRPKGSVSLSAILREMLASTPEGSDKTYARGIVEATVRDALKGDGQARKLCWAHIEGDPAKSAALYAANTPKPAREENLKVLFARLDALKAKALEQEGEVDGTS